MQDGSGRNSVARDKADILLGLGILKTDNDDSGVTQVCLAALDSLGSLPFQRPLPAFLRLSVADAIVGNEGTSPSSCSLPNHRALEESEDSVQEGAFGGRKHSVEQFSCPLGYTCIPVPSGTNQWRAQ